MSETWGTQERLLVNTQARSTFALQRESLALCLVAAEARGGWKPSWAMLLAASAANGHCRVGELSPGVLLDAFLGNEFPAEDATQIANALEDALSSLPGRRDIATTPGYQPKGTLTIPKEWQGMPVVWAQQLRGQQKSVQCLIEFLRLGAFQVRLPRDQAA